MKSLMNTAASAPLVIAILLFSSCNEAIKTPYQVATDSLSYVSSITFDSLHELQPDVIVERLPDGIIKVKITFTLTDSIKQDDWKVSIRPGFDPSFHWAPHLTPGPDNIIAQHVFRAPAMIVGNSERNLVVIPDLDLVGATPTVPWYMDMDVPNNVLTLGVSRSKVTAHVLFSREKGLKLPPGEFTFGFYLMMNDDGESLSDPWRKPLAFFWEKWSTPLFNAGQPIQGDLEPYVRHTYHWAFDSWAKSVWQEFMLHGKKVGAPVFIVNVTQSPNYPGEVNEREFRSVWNQAWFSSLRSASGLYRYGRRVGDKTLIHRATMTKALALLFPQHDGLFPAVIGTAMEEKQINNKRLSHSKGWGSYYFGNSNRNPAKDWGDASKAPYHILDMSWTALLMLEWHTELEQDEQLVAYAQRYADRLLQLQDADGFFPAWLDYKSQKPLPYLPRSPETSMSVTFLTMMYQVSKDKKYLDAATKALKAVTDNVVPVSQWEDFETYWSCSRVLDSLVGKKIKRNDAFKQNTLSMYWTAHALLAMSEATKDDRYLATGQRVLDELLMYQAVWQPPFIPIKALGGFGVMNGDGEWNDSRQSLFAELIMKYGKALHKKEYVERGISALRASFVMMYCPENPETKVQWEKVYPFFNEKDYGFMMENFGHGGETNAQGLGIGEFTIYDWGNGAAAEAYNKIVDHFGKDYSSLIP